MWPAVASGDSSRASRAATSAGGTTAAPLPPRDPREELAERDRQDRRGDPVPAHVQHAQAGVSVAEPEHVQVVPGELAARLERPREAGAGDLRRQRGEERPLDPRRRLQVAGVPVVGRGQLGRRGPQFLVVGVELRLQLLHLGDRPAQRQLGADAGEHHRKVERLGDVVVGSQLERLDDVLALALGGHHDDRQFDERIDAAEELEHLQPVHAGHHDVEQDEVELPLAEQVDGLPAAPGGGDRVLVPLQPAGEPLAVQFLVIDDQDGGLGRGHVGPVEARPHEIGGALHSLPGKWQFLCREIEGARLEFGRDYSPVSAGFGLVWRVGSPRPPGSGRRSAAPWRSRLATATRSKPRYVTALGETNEVHGRRPNKARGGGGIATLGLGTARLRAGFSWPRCACRPVLEGVRNRDDRSPDPFLAG